MDFTLESIETNIDAPEWTEFAFFSANFQHVMQIHGLPSQLQHFEQTVRFAQRQSTIDLSQGLASVCSTMLKDTLEAPAFIITFHFGFYRLIPVSLLKMGYRVALLVSREVFDSQQAFYAKALPPEWFDKLVFVLAEDGQLFFKIRQLRKKGYQILCYADGGAGAKPRNQADAEKATQVVLGEAYLQARSGFADMAYLLDAPLCLLMPPAEREAAWILDALEVYMPAGYASRKLYVKKVMGSLYAHLSRALLQTPYAWECWFYLHRTMLPKSFMETWPIADRFMPFTQGQQGFVLDKGLYEIYPLEENKFKKTLRFLRNSK